MYAIKNVEVLVSKSGRFTIAIGYTEKERIPMVAYILITTDDKQAIFFDELNLLCENIVLKDYPKDLLKEIIFDYCDTSYEFTDKNFRLTTQHELFEYLRNPIISLSHANVAIAIKQLILGFIFEWEKANESKYPEGYHKGNCYALLAEDYFNQRFYEAGFRNLLLQIVEDKRFDATYQLRSGFLNNSLVFERQYEGKLIKNTSMVLFYVIKRLKSIFDDYQTNISPAFTYNDFVEKFLLCEDEKITFYKLSFTRSFVSLHDEISYFNYDRDSLFSSSSFFIPIFDLSVIFEELLKNHYKTSYVDLNSAIQNLLVKNNWLSVSDYSFLNNTATGLYHSNWENQDNSSTLLQEALDLTFSSVGDLSIPLKAKILITNKILRNLNTPNSILTSVKTNEGLERVLTIICYGIFLLIEMDYYK